MAIIISKTVDTGGNEAVNAESFTLGIVRDDTSAVVVLAGTAMTNVATGQYQFSFTPPLPGLVYTISYVLVVGGQTITWYEIFLESCLY
jgi:hypothetical protein